MDFRHDGFDVWVFRRRAGTVEYLLLRASQEKADRWFGGGVFWQIPSDFVGDDSVVDAISRELARFGLTARAVWAAEHAYTIFNRRYQSIVHLAVFAAEVEAERVELGWEHDEARWVPAAHAAELVSFRGLVEGLTWVRRMVTEAPVPLAELRLL